MLMASAIALVGIGYGLWFGTLTVSETVRTGAVDLTFTGGFTDDDGEIDDISLDIEDDDEFNPQVYDFWTTTSSADPAATGEDPKAHYDKDMARCTTSFDQDSATITTQNVYPSYHCTAWLDFMATGNVPVKVKRITVTGAQGPVNVNPDNGTTSLDLSGDGIPDVVLSVDGLVLCHQIDPDDTERIRVEQHILQEAPQDATLSSTIEILLAQWNEVGIFITENYECSFPTGTARYQVTYTQDDDFDMGSLLNVNHELPENDRLRLNEEITPLPFIWVANSTRGTIVRIDVDTGEILGEYRSAPAGRGRDPSRTTVGLFGNVWSGNRFEAGDIDVDPGPDVEWVPHGSVVKMGLAVGGTRVESDGTPNPVGDYLQPPFDYNTCVDRDADGLIKTSRGLGDIRPWPNITDGVGGAGGGDARVEDAEDECVLVYQRTPNAVKISHVSVDANNDVWVGGDTITPGLFHKLDEDTGTILASFDAGPIGCGGYGGLLDGAGVLWSADNQHHTLLRYDVGAGTGACIPVLMSYGVAIDTNGFIWNSQFLADTIVKLDPAGVVQPGFPTSTGGAIGDSGVAVTSADNDVWVANRFGSDVSRLDNAGNLIGTVSVSSTPTGVAVDANGKVWVTNFGSDNMSRIDPSLGVAGQVDLLVDLGAGAGPDNYSDMTGAVAIGATSPQGTWSVVYDSGAASTTWGTISWNNEPEGSEPPGSSITVQARAADSQAGLGAESFVSVLNGVPFSLLGQFIEVRAKLTPSGAGQSPVLSDLTISSS